METYIEFLRKKIEVAPESGFNIDPDEVSKSLKPHQRDAVVWSIKGGRRALFESFGLGKTLQNLEWCRLIVKHEGGQALIVMPLGVKQEFERDAVNLIGIHKPTYVRNMEEIKQNKQEPILLTNYERVRDGDIDPTYFTAVSLDEAAVLRSFGSKTYQTFLDKFKGVKYKLVCTATPSPNKYKELIHYAGFLEISDTGNLLTKFFKRDSTKANNLTLYPHKEDEFWMWLSTWAMVITKPSDIGYSDEGYALPPLDLKTHIVTNGYCKAEERDGQFKIMNDVAVSLSDASHEKRNSIGIRVDKIRELILSYKADCDRYFQAVVWCDLNDEQKAIEKMLKSIGVSYVSLYGHDSIEKRESEIELWRNKQREVFLTKLDMYGSGVNLQQCNVMIFAGITYKFADTIQSIHREYRFGQDRTVHADMIFTDAEDVIYRTLMEKWQQHDNLQARMREIVKKIWAWRCDD